MSDLLRPIVGVLTGRSAIRRLNKQNNRFWSYPKIYQLAKARQEAQVSLYFFANENIDYLRGKITGTFYDEEDKLFKQKEFPLPDVLYNRGGGGSSTIAKLLTKKKSIKFNPTTFNKWSVCSNLQKFPEVKDYLPGTKLYQRDQDIIDFLEENSEAYLKGVRGGRGKQIVYIRKLPKRGYEYSHYVGKLNIEQVDDILELCKKIHDFYKGRQFIIQKPINLIKLADSRVDFRAELQRDGHGKLTISGIMARVGKSCAPITIHSHAYPIEIFFKEFLNYSDEKIQELSGQIRQFLFSIYESIEKCFGMFGEIGIDFGIDASGEIWFIETNSISAKVSLMKAYDEKIFHQAFLKPLQFARYLYFNKH